MEPIKLDYTLETAEERTELVRKICSQIPPEEMNQRYINLLTKYIFDAADKQERKERKILTDNRMVTVNSRETSYQGLASKFENGEDGIYNLMTEDKNIIFKPNAQITEKDIAEIEPLRVLREAIAEVEAAEKKATGRRRFLLRKQLIEMRRDQYTIRAEYRKPIYCQNLIKSFSKLDLSENITFDENQEPHSDGIITFFNPKHVSALLCNYTKLKEDSWDKFSSDSYYMLKDLDNVVEKALADYPLYMDIVIAKIDGLQNTAIQEIIQEKYSIKHSVEYISSLWRNKIPKMIAEQAKEDYILWYFTNKERGKWKKCSRCGEIKLAHNRFFSKNASSKDGYYSICKCCRNKKNKEVK